MASPNFSDTQVPTSSSKPQRDGIRQFYQLQFLSANKDGQQKLMRIVWASISRRCWLNKYNQIHWSHRQNVSCHPGGDDCILSPKSNKFGFGLVGKDFLCKDMWRLYNILNIHDPPWTDLPAFHAGSCFWLWVKPVFRCTQDNYESGWSTVILWKDITWKGMRLDFPWFSQEIVP